MVHATAAVAPPAATTLFHAFRPAVVFAATTLGNPFTTSINAAVPTATLAAAVVPTAPILTATVTVATP